MKMVIYLKSGAHFAVDITKYEVGRSPITGELAELSWTSPRDAASKLSYVRLDEVVAVIRVAEPEPSDG